MKKDKKCLVIKASLFNALLPKFLKHFWLNSGFTLVLGLIYFLISTFFELSFNIFTIFYLVILTLFISTIMISKDLIKILNTKYLFYARHMEYKYSFFVVESHSINYSQITDIEIRTNIWDHMCGVGDLIIQTSNDKLLDKNGVDKDYLRVRDVKNPEHIKNQIMSRIHL